LGGDALARASGHLLQGLGETEETGTRLGTRLGGNSNAAAVLLPEAVLTPLPPILASTLSLVMASSSSCAVFERVKQ
jgi:hypothetical protein